MAIVKGPPKRRKTEEQHRFRALPIRPVCFALMSSRILPRWSFRRPQPRSSLYGKFFLSCMKGHENDSPMDEQCQRQCVKKSFPSFFLALTRTVREKMFGNEFLCELCVVSGIHVSAHCLRIERLPNET